MQKLQHWVIVSPVLCSYSEKANTEYEGIFILLLLQRLVNYLQLKLI